MNRAPDHLHGLAPIRTQLLIVGASSLVVMLVALTSFTAGVHWSEARHATAPTLPAEPGRPAPSHAGSTRAGVLPDRVFPRLVPPADFDPPGAVLIGAAELSPVHPETFVAVVAALHDETEVVAILSSEQDVEVARAQLRDAGLPHDAIHYLIAPLDSAWIRDYGPLFAYGEASVPLFVDAQYSNVDADQERTHDDDLPALLGRLAGIPTIHVPLRFEGGNCLSNGDGLLVTSTSVIRRNLGRGYDVQTISRIFSRQLGYRQWTYVQPLEGEVTGHADMFITFATPNRVIVAACDPQVDAENAVRLDDAARLLAQSQTSRGPMEVYRIPLPILGDGEWRSYNNVIMAGKMVLVPLFSDVDPEVQAEAFATYRRLLPERRIVGIPCDSLVPARGLLHCIALPVPTQYNLAPLLSRADDDRVIRFDFGELLPDA